MTQTLDDLRAEIDELHRLGVSAEYARKQLHKIPPAPVVDRVQYILRHCAGKRVLHLGCGWPPGYLHQAIERVAGHLRGMDILCPVKDFGQRHQYQQQDLDHIEDDDLINAMDADIIVLAEILEHLGCPGRVLEVLREYEKSLLITVPNAHAKVGRHHITGGIENCHRQHVAYYSYTTLRELVTRYGYAIVEMAWYNCPRNALPQESEGLIMVVR